MLYLLLIAGVLFWTLYHFCWIPHPPGYPPGPQFIIPILSTTVEEAKLMLFGGDVVKLHKKYQKRLVSIFP